MSRLQPQHEAELAGSCISPELIESRRYATVGPEHRGWLQDAGIPAWAVRDDSAFPGLAIPRYRVRTGEYIGIQFKPAVPQPHPSTGKTPKYVSPKGMNLRVGVHPACTGWVNDAALPLWITEGEKKADALASLGLAAVSLTGVWNWRNQEGTLGDWEDVPLRGRPVAVCFDSDAVTNPKVRAAMRRLVDWLRSRGATAHYLVVPAEVGGVPVKGVDDYFAAGGTLPALYAAASESAPRDTGSKDATLTEAFLTDAVCSEALEGRFLYAQGLGWMRYDGCRWVQTDDSLIVEEVRLWAKGHWEDVLEEYKHDHSREVEARINGWKQVLTAGRIRALASLAKGPLHALASEFDRHPDLLNTPNGVVDLRTGELLDPDPEYRMTKVTGAEYDPSAADDPDFRQALRALPDDVVPWYQLRIGQAFTGYMTPDDVMLVQQGGGENGKSTLAVPIARAAGDYQVQLSDRVILGNVDQHPTEMMDLRGARLALMEETPEARQLNVQQLKKTVGTPQITARRIRQDPVTFDATHSLFVNTNFAPAVAETDHATWRRLAMLRFPYTFRSRPGDVVSETDRLGDPALRDRCKLDQGPARAALAWAVAGAVRWYEAGKVLPPHPDRIVADTLAWRREGDLIMSFLEERLEVDPEAMTAPMDLFNTFGQWLVPTGHKPWSKRTFDSRFGAHDRVQAHRIEYKVKWVDGAAKRVWWGVRIAPSGMTTIPVPGNSPF